MDELQQDENSVVGSNTVPHLVDQVLRISQRLRLLLRRRRGGGGCPRGADWRRRRRRAGDEDASCISVDGGAHAVYDQAECGLSDLRGILGKLTREMDIFCTLERNKS